MSKPNITLKSFKYRLYPTSAQVERLDFLLWQGRKIYNGALAMRKEAYEQRGESISLYDLRDHWCAQRKVEPETFGQLPSKTVDALIRRLDKAYKAFFRRLKAGEVAGFPRFKGRYHFNSLEFVWGVGIKLTVTDTRHSRLRIMNVGEIALRDHRPLPEDGAPKYAVVKRDKLDKWWVSIAVEIPLVELPSLDSPAVGIDVGLMKALVLSDGREFNALKWYQGAQQKRTRLARQLARRQKLDKNGDPLPSHQQSQNWRDAKRAIAHLEADIESQRRYFWHGVTDQLTTDYGLIALEDLSLKFMLENKHLSKAAHNIGIGLFRQLLEYKAKERGVTIIYVPPQYTSQMCSQCGALVPKELNQRIHRCSCGLEIDRDLNAVKNILNLALNGAVPALRGVTQANGSNVPRESSFSEAVATESSET